MSSGNLHSMVFVALAFMLKGKWENNIKKPKARENNAYQPHIDQGEYSLGKEDYRLAIYMRLFTFYWQKLT